MIHFIRLTSIYALSAVLILSGCDKANKQSVVENAANNSCLPITGVDSLLSSKADIIVIGESHGMVEPPEFVEALLCHSLSKGLKTALALELNDDHNLLEVYLSSDGSEAAKNAFFDDWAWKGQFTDGWSSQAMMELIDRARLLNQDTKAFEVIPFKPSNMPIEDFQNQNARSQAYEKTMAKRIVEGSEKVDADKTIVLVGSLHARKGHFSFREMEYDLMAIHLPENQTETYLGVHTGGTSWSCRGPEPDDCGQYEVKGHIELDSKMGRDETFMVVKNDSSDIIDLLDPSYYQTEWYDGIIYLGAATASPPANKDGRIPFEEDMK